MTLRVFMTADAVGGVWSYATDLAAGLVGADMDVTIATLGPAPTQAQVQAVPTGARVVETGLALDWLADDLGTLRVCGSRLAALADGFGADLIHLNSPAYAALATFGAPVVGVCHSCVGTWWDAVRGGEMPDDLRWRADLLVDAYAACDLLLAPSRSFAMATALRYGVLPLAVLNGRNSAARRFRAAEKEPFAITSGRLWDAGKNALALDHAASYMRGSVLAAGPTEGPSGEQVSLASLKRLGSLDEDALTELLNRASVFVSLAKYEPFGLGVLEAAQSGCALVLSDTPIFRELWSECALFVDADDPLAVAACLDGLLEDQPEALRRGRAAGARAAQLTADAMLEGTLAAYESIRRGAALKLGSAA
ncbi:MAG TPA: glycosyltransferase family 4 protein [Bradyrhizobium sp.]